jgi:aspartyl-tRNA(Asn)/glutamyl-tRNA(Gln) amidotransferase subunit B
VDANVSVHQKGEPLGTRAEIKNIGSVRGVAGAVKYEIERQIQIKESGGVVENETRAWDASRKITVAMRDKEQQQVR